MANGKSKAKVRLVKDEPATEAPLTIEKPTGGSGLDKFKSKRSPTIGGVENLQSALPHHNIAQHGTSFACIPTKRITGRPELVLRFCSDQRPEKRSVAPGRRGHRACSLIQR